MRKLLWSVAIYYPKDGFQKIIAREKRKKKNIFFCYKQLHQHFHTNWAYMRSVSCITYSINYAAKILTWTCQPSEITMKFEKKNMFTFSLNVNMFFEMCFQGWINYQFYDNNVRKQKIRTISLIIMVQFLNISSRFENRHTKTSDIIFFSFNFEWIPSAIYC